MGAVTITLRAATSRDISAIDDMLSATYPRLLKADYAPSVMVTAVPIIARANPSLVTSGSYYVAETPDGRILGAGGWSRIGAGREAAEVRHLVTDWRHLRRGVGRRLMMAIMAEASQAGVRRMEVRSTRTAVPFYGALGFENLAAVKVQLRPGIEFPVTVMRRFL